MFSKKIPVLVMAALFAAKMVAALVAIFLMGMRQRSAGAHRQGAGRQIFQLPHVFVLRQAVHGQAQLFEHHDRAPQAGHARRARHGSTTG